MRHRAGAVASYSIELAIRGVQFSASDIRRGLNDPPSKSTVYRVLRQLEQDEWITQLGNGWQPGMKAQMLGDIDNDRDEDDQEINISASDVF